MAKILGEFLHDLAKKSGIKDDDETFKNFISADAFQKIEIPEEIQRGIENSLISVTDAMNSHPKIKSHYTATSLKPIDEWIDQALEEYGIPEEMREEIRKEGSTYNKPKLLVKRIKELEAKKAVSTDRGDKQNLQKQIDDLQAQRRADQDMITQIKSQAAQDKLNMQIDYKLDSLTGRYKTVYDTLDPDVKALTIRTLINKNLQDKNAKFTFDENNNFVLRQKDDSNYYGDNNQLVNPQSFLDSIMSQNKILVVTQPNGQPNGSQQQTPGQPPKQANGNNPVSPVLMEILQNSQQDLNRPKAVYQ